MSIAGFARSGPLAQEEEVEGARGCCIARATHANDAGRHTFSHFNDNDVYTCFGNCLEDSHVHFVSVSFIFFIVCPSSLSFVYFSLLV